MSKIAKYYLSADGARIYYEIYGHGTPLIFLHGNSQDSSYFYHQVQFFQQDYQVILIDNRGHGRSTLGKATLSFLQMAQDLAAIMKYEQIEKAAIIGFSDGANVAMLFAANDPQKVLRLVLNAGNTKVRGMKNPMIFLTYLQHAGLKVLSRFLPGYKDKAAIVDLMLHDSGISKAILQQIKRPTLVVAGQFDVIKKQQTEFIAENIPHAQLVFVPLAQHTFAKRQPEKFNQIVQTFLRSLI